MEQYIIEGGTPLKGEVTISGAKNAALGILAASILTDEDVLIENIPDVNDINVMLEAISNIGARVDRIDAHTVKINGSTISELERREFRFRAAAPSAPGRSISTSRDSARSARRSRSTAVLFTLTRTS